MPGSLEDDKLIKNYKRYFVRPDLLDVEKADWYKERDRVLYSLTSFINNHRGAKRVTICVTDNTRPFPDKKILPYLLDCLQKNGISRQGITIFVATGLHRHLKGQELVEKFGEEIVERYRIVQNDPADSIALGGNLYVNRMLSESDLLIGTGVFEPHQYAGFSGGSKIFIIGCGGRRTIDFTHSSNMILKSGVRLGNVNRNPFRDFIERSARYLPPRWILNIVVDGMGEIIALDCGEPEIVFNNLSKWYLKNLAHIFRKRFDAAFITIGEKKGRNLYQASRGATYIALSNSSVLKRGSPIIISAKLQEGIGKGEGEREFYRVLSSHMSNRRLLNSLKSGRFKGGGQRALMLLLTLMRHPVIFTGYIKRPDFQRENLFFVSDKSHAIDMVLSDYGCNKIIYITNPFFGLFKFSEGDRRDD